MTPSCKDAPSVWRRTGLAPLCRPPQGPSQSAGVKRRGAGQVLARPSVQAAQSSRRSKRSRRPLVTKDPPTPNQEALEPLFVLSSRYQIYLVTAATLKPYSYP